MDDKSVILTKYDKHDFPLVLPSRSPTCISMIHSQCNRDMIKSLEDINLADVILDGTKNVSNKMKRSVTMKDINEFRMSRKSNSSNSFERIKMAKDKVDEAIKKGKVFSVLGPYRRVREVLRSRGWVEKFFLNESGSNTNAKKSRSISKSVVDKNPLNEGFETDDADDDDIDDIDDDDNIGDDLNQNDILPWEEDDGIYGIMSRMLKNYQPNLFWTLRKNQVDYKTLRKDQTINHHGKAGCFTTKTGLARHLNQVRWYDDKEPDDFFPRCYIISNVEDRQAFIDNFYFTACVGLIKEAITREDEPDIQKTTIDEGDNISTYGDNEVSVATDVFNLPRNSKKVLPKIKYSSRRSIERSISSKYLEMAIAYCEYNLKVKNHEDIDRNEFIFCWSVNWEEFLTNYYKVVHENCKIEGGHNHGTYERCMKLLEELRKKFPQFDMDGSRNVWILKPGAKSRGRGITCYSHLSDILKASGINTNFNDARLIVQKYIEKPLLIYKTKFDIRQWFMVTDWNPLTVWWYKDCYLRFCSQQFTLDDFNEAVHLSNNSIQYKYHNGPRSNLLPEENMWDWTQFEKWLKDKGYGDVYYTKILPGMKDAVIDVLLCVQDNMEWRKNTFELYGADFMVSENDLKPWLIEVNSSPCMASSTAITARLTSNVLEDVFKVVLDRRENKLCDVGQFELVYKQSAISIPPYIGIDLRLAGTSIKNPSVQPKEVKEIIVVAERRTRPITDSAIIRTKSKENAAGPRRKIPNTSVSLEKGNKSPDLTLHRRSKTTLVVSSRQMKAEQPKNRLALSYPAPTSTILTKSKQLSLEKTSQGENLKSSLKETTSKSMKGHNSIQTENVKTIVKEVNNSDIEVDREDPISFVHDESCRISFNDVLIATSRRDYDDNQNNRYEPKPKITVDDILTTIPKPNNVQKTSSSREYKLPTKVEIVNFSMAKKMMNESLKEIPLNRRIKQNRHLKKTSNSQIYMQKYILARSMHTYRNSNSGRVQPSINNIDYRIMRRYKTNLSPCLQSSTGDKFISRRPDSTKVRNNVVLLQFTTPVL